MAKLHFYYASMNAGKSTALLQADFNYRERGMATMLWTAAIDDRPPAGRAEDRGGQDRGAIAISSRIGIGAPAHRFSETTDLWVSIATAHALEPLAAVLVDEAQFLSPAQVWQLARLADEAGLPVLCYGLRTDFRGALFPGSAVLLGIADRLVELRAVCHCGAKATMNMRTDADGVPVREGAQTEIGGNDRYLALCRRHFREALGL
ncbi:thymidine kinase [Novosphingobium nitrogenifigens DSM 19370]|uniref:Thymidine kinase n=1 Tax=Novosphingobium nitrogenifigens DSM 19370 TaxID=983920 RepID=F1ZAL3_9SPHN|nr:thymidine kinase [Novosphingobium nitrogenifigens]EGD58350.1 thymidine kinase [Novosphingobium nitrogenifigens DSM 19370]